MEFSYKLTEADYLIASRIPITRLHRKWARVVGYGYLAQLFLSVWGALLAGMCLELSDLIGISVEIKKFPPASQLLLASIMPAICYFGILIVVLRIRFLRWFQTRISIEHFRTDPSCYAETTARITSQGVTFRSDLGYSESVWAPYSTWAERNHILILVTRAGVRKVLKVSGLTQEQRSSLRAILATALPRK